MTLPNHRSLSAALLSAAVLLGAGAAEAEPPVVGATVPDLKLPTLDGETRTLSERAGPTILVFFRGAW